MRVTAAQQLTIMRLFGELENVCKSQDISLHQFWSLSMVQWILWIGVAVQAGALICKRLMCVYVLLYDTHITQSAGLKLSLLAIDQQPHHIAFRMCCSFLTQL